MARENGDCMNCGHKLFSHSHKWMFEDRAPGPYDCRAYAPIYGQHIPFDEVLRKLEAYKKIPKVGELREEIKSHERS